MGGVSAPPCIVEGNVYAIHMHTKIGFKHEYKKYYYIFAEAANK